MRVITDGSTAKVRRKGEALVVSAMGRVLPSTLRGPDETRQAYILALRAADRHDFRLLVAFLRS